MAIYPVGFECKFKEIQEFASLFPDAGAKKRLGKYHGSKFKFPALYREYVPLAAYISINYSQLLEEGKSKREIVDGCVKYLNTQIHRNKPIYGNLVLHSFSFVKKWGEELISVLLLTNSRDNKNFWKI